MKTVRCLIMLGLALLTACSSHDPSTHSSSESTSPQTSKSESSQSEKTGAADANQKEDMTMKLDINGQSIQVTWADNLTVTALRKQLAKGPIEIEVEDYAGMEKVGNLPVTLTSSNQQLSTTAGDITLYQGRALAFYYGNNHYSLTPIGKIEGLSKSEIRQLLTSQEKLTVRISLGQ